MEGEGGAGGRKKRGDAEVEKGILFAVPLFGKAESLMPLNFGVSDRTDRHAIRLCRRLNTCLFLSSEDDKKS